MHYHRWWGYCFFTALSETTRSGWLAAFSNVAILSDDCCRVSRRRATRSRIRITLDLTAFSDSGSSAKKQHSPHLNGNPSGPTWFPPYWVSWAFRCRARSLRSRVFPSRDGRA
jgi:hypothetical protein